MSLLAAGKCGFSQHYIGHKVWPKLGFNASLRPNEIAKIPHLARCKSVQDATAATGRIFEFPYKRIPVATKEM